jgi:hypothetical protein
MGGQECPLDGAELRGGMNEAIARHLRNDVPQGFQVGGRATIGNEHPGRLSYEIDERLRRRDWCKMVDRALLNPDEGGNGRAGRGWHRHLGPLARIARNCTGSGLLRRELWKDAGQCATNAQRLTPPHRDDALLANLHNDTIVSEHRPSSAGERVGERRLAASSRPDEKPRATRRVYHPSRMNVIAPTLAQAEDSAGPRKLTPRTWRRLAVTGSSDQSTAAHK